MTACQKNIWTNKGIFLTVSTRPEDDLCTTQFLESRATPITVPSMVATKIPDIAIRNILAIPTCRACKPDSGYVTKPSEIRTPGVVPRNLQEKGKLVAFRFSIA